MQAESKDIFACTVCITLFIRQYRNAYSSAILQCRKVIQGRAIIKINLINKYKYREICGHIYLNVFFFLDYLVKQSPTILESTIGPYLLIKKHNFIGSRTNVRFFRRFFPNCSIFSGFFPTSLNFSDFCP